MTPQTEDPATPASFLTPVDHVFVRTHLGAVPEIAGADWALTVEGLVEQPSRWDLRALMSLPQAGLTAVHECFGSPFRPDVPTRAVANLEWTGVPLSAVLERARPLPTARHVVFEGADTGSFAGADHLSYVKDLPLSAARAGVLLAHTMNGGPLLPQHGFPLRAVAPRMFGTNSVKWLTRIVLSDTRPDHMFTTQLYNRTLPGEATPSPVREVDVNCKLLAPYDGDEVPPGDVRIMGRAWSSAEVVGVEVAVDDGPWQATVLEPADPATAAWQRFTIDHTLSPGEHRIRARATDRAGRVQPTAGTRNAVHEITVRVR